MWGNSLIDKQRCLSEKGGEKGNSYGVGFWRDSRAF
jgi:hypothetical protein